VSVLADVAVRILHEPDHGRDWVDVWTLVFAGLAAFGTVGAVLVALFGPGIRARRTRPLLSIRAAGSQSLDGSPRDDFVVVGLEISNAEGRRQANDVEILATVVAPLTSMFGEGAGMTVVEQEQLVYTNYPMKAVTASVPPGLRRSVAFCLAGTKEDFDRRFRPRSGNLLQGRKPDTTHVVMIAASSQLASGAYPTIAPGAYIDTYYVLFEVVARDVDTSRFVGRCRIGTNDGDALFFSWLDSPTPADKSIKDPTSFEYWLGQHGKPSAHMEILPVPEPEDD
jgi:hypothetical protein